MVESDTVQKLANGIIIPVGPETILGYLVPATREGHRPGAAYLPGSRLNSFRAHR